MGFPLTIVACVAHSPGVSAVASQVAAPTEAHLARLTSLHSGSNKTITLAYHAFVTFRPRSGLTPHPCRQQLLLRFHA